MVAKTNNIIWFQFSWRVVMFLCFVIGFTFHNHIDYASPFGIALFALWLSFVPLLIDATPKRISAYLSVSIGFGFHPVLVYAMQGLPSGSWLRHQTPGVVFVWLIVACYVWWKGICEILLK
jgi:hypothetical protein